MIVPMKRLTVLMLGKERDASLALLQDLGVLHLTQASPEGDDGVARARANLDAAKEAAAVLEAAAPKRDPAAESKEAPGEVATVAEEVLRLSRRLDEIRQSRIGIEAEFDRLEPLGDFDPEAVHHLGSRGIAVRLLRAPAAWAPELDGDVVLHPLARDGRHRLLALVGRAKAVSEVDLGEGHKGASDLALPKASPAALRGRLAALGDEAERSREILSRLAPHLPAIRLLGAAAEDRLRFEEARAAMAESGPLALIQGYCPAREIPGIEAAANAHGWGLLIDEIEDPAQVPIAIENPRWVRPIKALFEFIGVLPGYDQLDVSVPFLIFFSLFFAMIVGDAGYGMIFLILTEVARIRFKRAPKLLFSLLRLQSVCAIIWGVLIGNYFGISLLPHPLKALQIAWLTNQNNVIFLTFLIGAIHLTLAHGWNVIRLLPSPRALAQTGWILSTWTMFFAANSLVLGAPFPHVLYWVIGIGVVLIAGFMTPWRALKEEWFNHAMLPLSLVSNFVDVVSYVRLFAVGLATFAVAQAFNRMAAHTAAGGLVASFGAALILFVGHTLNILLATMGVLVHGIRLNTLEFAGHLGMEWTGRPYRPFAHPPEHQERA